jgi:hypothetical protein
MITAVDTNILIDIFLDDKTFGRSSAKQLRSCLQDGALVVCGVVFVETAPLFPSVDACLNALAALSIRNTTIALYSYMAAASAWRAYRESGGARNRMVADFLIGAHALVECDRLLTRDRGFYRKYFQKLRVFE